MNETSSREPSRILVQEGQYLFHAGDEADCAYLVEEGRLQVIQDIDGTEFPIAEIGPHELVGEIGILGDQPRTASVRALEKTVLVILTQEGIERILESDPGMAKRLVRVLIRRLTRLLETVIKQREQRYRIMDEARQDWKPRIQAKPAEREKPRIESIPAGEKTEKEPMQAGEEMSIELPGNIVMTFCYVPAGEFYMGSTGSGHVMSEDEAPVHLVRITRPFWLAKYPVTQEQWKSVMRENPSEFQDEDAPVHCVSWYDCQKFLNKLRNRQQKGFRFPTEAEWEYACRAGSTTRFYWGDDPDEYEIDLYAWYSDNSMGETRPEQPENPYAVGAAKPRPMGMRKRPHGVGQKRPNRWGLHDMVGNVWEWCHDRYAPYEEQAITIDPRGPQLGKDQVIRGGSWFNVPLFLRSAKRFKNNPESCQNIIGFRPARTATE
ncbi:MAG TPA: SUMF1/EgtB/PvdO family nonheme iron enzyme [bacterium]|nr:SUMF1/EgtB/PvdO family nonheme iron enzyme [bacterium]HQO35260.1 SUMF1/EgtB/PvdO family nonheme iron enzyme [bacterium]